MSDANVILDHRQARRQQLSVWELPKLLRSVHQHRKSSTKKCRERPHFRAILAYVHRNRFAVANQIQRRFSKYLKSDRTARRHLAEMESLGYLSVVDSKNTSPLWPKVYFVTGRGVARLRKALHDQGQEWSEAAHDRGRPDGYSAQHILHELLITDVDGGPKWRRGGSVAAVETGGALWCSLVSWQDGGESPDLAPADREAQECDAIWSFGKRFVGVC